VSRPIPLSELLAGVPGVSLDGDPETIVGGVGLDSRRVRPGELFAALPGASQDGLSYVHDALRAGAAAILAGCPRQPQAEDAAWIHAEDPRRSLALIARNFHSRPDERVTLVGITGTNGKTTVAALVCEILEEFGLKTGLIGTVSYRIGERETPAGRTTPEAPDLYRMFEEMVADGCRYAAIEISSHGLALERVAGLSVAVAVFTNLTRDHLDFHGDVESYAAAKRRLFSERLRRDGVAIACADDPRCREMLAAAPETARRLTFGFADGADIRIRLCRAGLDGTELAMELPGGRIVEERTALPGGPGALNIAAAVAAAHALGLDPERACHAAAGFPGVPGRFERVDRGQEFAVIVDFAHTDSAMSGLLSAVREMGPGRLITVFGCGGDRDRSKRAPMGAAAIRHSDMVFLTSDNPRTEPPERILREVEAGISAEPGSSGRYRVLPDRREAIFAAIASAGPGDAVVIAGKGHETVQILKDRTVPFDDRIVAAEALDLRAGRPAAAPVSGGRSGRA